MILQLPALFHLVMVLLKYSVSHRVKLIEPGALVDLGIEGCTGGKWHDFDNGATYPEDTVVEVTPGNATELVCVRGTDMETLVLIMIKQGMIFLSDRGEGRWRGENVTFVCQVEFWTQSRKFFHLSISTSGEERKTTKRLEGIKARRDGSLVSMAVNYTYVDDDGGGGDDDDDVHGYSCDWEIQFDDSESERAVLESRKLNMGIFEPVNGVRPLGTALTTNATIVECLAKGFPKPHLCSCDLGNPSADYTPNSSEATSLRLGRVTYLVTCLAENSIRGVVYNSTWIGYLDVQSLESSGWKHDRGLEKIIIITTIVRSCHALF